LRALPADTIKAPLARGELPVLIGIGAPYRWDREALFSTGAFTLGDLLERIPGVTRLRAGWLASADHAAVLGDVARVRVFYDGLELDALDPRGGGLLDLSEVQLWTLEEVEVERGADEVRVFIRSWRVDRTTTNTRTDVATGDENTNLYRGFFGRRFRQGAALQLAAQEYGYNAGNQFLGGGDQLALLGRLGWARRGWSIDAFALRGRNTRDVQARLVDQSTIPAERGTRTDAYLRVASGDPARGRWLQLLAGSLGYTLQSSTASGGRVDTNRVHQQYVLAGGTTLGGLQVSATGRAHVFGHATHAAASARAALTTGRLGLSVYTEQRRRDTTSVEEAAARLSPLSWLAVSGVVARRHGGRDGSPAVVTARGEAGIRWREVWATGGIMLRDTAPVLSAPVAFDTSYAARRDTARPLGYFGTVRGRIWRDVFADVYAVHWTHAGWYRPQTQVRAEVYLQTNWLRRFPSGDFGFRGSFALTHTSPTLFPRTNGVVDVSTGLQELTSLIEVRIVDAEVFFQQRLRLYPAQPTLVPGFVLSRQISIYGIRWQFWN
jgi:hypothetical protein